MQNEQLNIYGVQAAAIKNVKLPKQPKAKRCRLRSKMRRVVVRMPVGLLEAVDQAASQELTTRSNIIRIALTYYLRPQGREIDQADPEEVYQVLHKRRSAAALRHIIETLDIDPYD